tara:strand:- start:688 stop:825 length:138 start_codon:yes stop_codon:yes gene_type:complete
MNPLVEINVHNYTNVVWELGCPVIAITDNSQHRIINPDVNLMDKR